MARKSHNFIFPVTKCNYIYVVTPDTQYNDEGVWQVSMVYTKDQAEELKRKVEALDDSFKGLFKYTEKDDGTCVIQAKQKKVLRWKKAGEQQEVIMTPRVMTKDNKLFEGKTNPWGGTVAEVGVVVETQAGANKKGTILCLRLRGFRIHELVSGGDSDPMFGGAVADDKEEVVVETDDLPFDVDGDDDDCPI